MKKLLVVVDYQKDFVSGSLGFDKAKELDKGIAQRIRETNENGGFIIATMDTHDSDYINTQEGKRLPIKHCIHNTEGWRIYGETREALEGVMRPDMNARYVAKKTFGSTRLQKLLQFEFGEIGEIELCGVVTNMCVISNAVLCKAILPEARIVINAGLCASFNDDLHEQALNVMESMQMDIINRQGV